MALLRNFFQKLPQNWWKLKTHQKSVKMSKISKFCDFWAISTCNTSKESIFHIEFNFKQKKYDLFQEKFKKSNFFTFFFKIDADLLFSNARFSNLCQKIWKLSWPLFLKDFEIKRRAHYFYPNGNGRAHTARYGSRHPLSHCPF